MFKLLAQQHQKFVLSIQHKLLLSQKWDEINADPGSFVTRERRDQATIEEIKLENSGLGKFAAGQVARVCQTTRHGVHRRLDGKRKILAVGYGQGWDSGWLPDAGAGGLQTWWIDVSPVACNRATREMDEAWKRWRSSNNSLFVCPAAPVINQGEIRSVLLDPANIDLDLDSVEVWYWCRSLFALSKTGARIVLQIMGQSVGEEKDPDKRKRIVLIVPLRENNLGRQTDRSISMTRHQILSNIRLGAGRPLELENEEFHIYFGVRVYTAMTIKAR